jgi:hypothetical protein
MAGDTNCNAGKKKQNNQPRAKTGEPYAQQAWFPARAQRGGGSTDSDVTLAMSDRSCPCSEGLDTTNPANISPTAATRLRPRP